MTPDLIAAFVLYAFVSSITPGPNNTMLLASGVNFGIKASLPHMLGITIGFSILVLSCGLGIGALFELWPALHDVLKYAGALYMAWLAWKIARSGAPQSAGAKPKPFTFLQAAAFQWINPKAWIMAIGAIAAYTPADGFFTNVLIITLLYGLTGAPCCFSWGPQAGCCAASWPARHGCRPSTSPWPFCFWHRSIRSWSMPHRTSAS